MIGETVFRLWGCEKKHLAETLLQFELHIFHSEPSCVYN